VSAAEVDGAVITVADVDARLAANHDLSDEVAGLDQRFVRVAERTTLDQLIAEMLLAQDARRIGVSPEHLRASVVREVTVADADVERAYRLARAYPGGNPMLERRVRRLLAGDEPAARARVRAFVQTEMEWVAIQNFVAPLRRQSRIIVRLESPPEKPH